MHQTAELKTEITRMLAVFAPHHLNNVGGGHISYITFDRHDCTL